MAAVTNKQQGWSEEETAALQYILAFGPTGIRGDNKTIVELLGTSRTPIAVGKKIVRLREDLESKNAVIAEKIKALGPVGTPKRGRKAGVKVTNGHDDDDDESPSKKQKTTKVGTKVSDATEDAAEVNGQRDEVV